jgi:hypothetical protein
MGSGLDGSFTNLGLNGPGLDELGTGQYGFSSISKKKYIYIVKYENNEKKRKKKKKKKKRKY